MRAFVIAVLLFLFWVPSAFAWTWPVQGPVLLGFVFDSSHPYAGGQHRGIDVGAAPGTSVAAPASGTVSFAGSVPTSGKAVTIETADGYSVTLTHLGSIAVSKGASVGEGETVGTVGPSGTPELDVPYVYMGVRVTANAQGYVDPLSLLPQLPPPVTASPAPSPPPPAPAPAPVTTTTPDTSTTAESAQPTAADASPAAAPTDATSAPDAAAPPVSDAEPAPDAAASPAAPADAPPPPAADAAPPPAADTAAPDTGSADGKVTTPPPADTPAATAAPPVPEPASAAAPPPPAPVAAPPAPTETAPPPVPEPESAAAPPPPAPVAAPPSASVINPDPGIDPTAVEDAQPAQAAPPGTAQPSDVVGSSGAAPLPSLAEVDDAFRVHVRLPVVATVLVPTASQRAAAPPPQEHHLAAVAPRRFAPHAVVVRPRARTHGPGNRRAGGLRIVRRVVPIAAPRQRRGRFPVLLVLALALALGCAVVAKAVRMISRVPESSEGAHTDAAAEDLGSRGVAVRERTTAPRPCRRPRRAFGHLRPLSPAQGQRRPDGERDGRARHAGHGLRRSRRRAAA